jgi:hypothetical protein
MSTSKLYFESGRRGIIERVKTTAEVIMHKDYPYARCISE